MKTQSKIAGIFFLASLSMILLLSAGVYFFIIRYSFSDFYKRLEIRGVITAKAQLDNEVAGLPVLKEMREMHLEKLPEEHEYFFPIKEGYGFEKEAGKLKIPVSFFQDIVNTGTATYQRENTFFAGLKYEGHTGTYAVIVSADNYYNSHHLSYLRTIFLVGVLVSSLISLSLAILFSRQILNPVKEISSRLKQVSSQSLNVRLEPSKANDEIQALETTFNGMLDRLETSFETQNNFISNASHELRTPLTAIIGEADVTLARDRTVSEYKESLRVVIDQAERLEKITKSLLFLAQTGFTNKVQQFDMIRIDQLLWDVKNTIEKIHPESNVHINLTLLPENPEKLKMMGNEQLLHIAMTNIVSNACKYSNNQPVTLSIGTADGKVIIVVKDHGIGIPENELPYIYDPFFRASNSTVYEGYGIGLPLARNIVRMHHGEILVSSSVNVGTTVQLTFPV